MMRASAWLEVILVNHSPIDQCKEQSFPQAHAAAQAIAPTGPSHSHSVSLSSFFTTWCKTSEFLLQNEALTNMHSVYINMSGSDLYNMQAMSILPKRSNSLDKQTS
jgi:hypothetical protein